MGVKLGSKRGNYRRRERSKKYVCACSFGKDSLASVLIAIEEGEPLDAVVYVEVMYDNSRGISGEYPSHIRWINDVAIPKLESLGVNVIHLRSESDYISCYHKEIGSGLNKGKISGFPIARKCMIQRECKLGPINRWYREGYLRDGYDIVEYVGIAIDERERLLSMDSGGSNRGSVRISKESLLYKYGYSESMALLKCAEYGLLSPIYFDGTSRNGCWMCPNQGIGNFVSLRRVYPELWEELCLLDNVGNRASDRFKYNLSLEDVRVKMDEYEEKYGKYLQILK